MSITPTLAIIGRPNVGKSTLFNRLVGRRAAIVDDTPGVTRDRREGEAMLGPHRVRVIDTAGLEEAPPESMAARMRNQTERAVDEADLALMVIDARAGVTPADAHFAKWLRRHGVPVLLIANKCEGRAGEAGYYEGFELGLGEPIALSAEHNEGLGELLTAIARHFEHAGIAPDDDENDDEAPLRIAIVGRPNVGKSTLINRLIGAERLLTGPEAGLTRDAIEIRWFYKGRGIAMFDTAGLRRQARIAERLEHLSVADTRRAIQYAEVAVVVIDASEPPNKQDIQIAAEVWDEGRALVIAANKWDRVVDPEATLETLKDRLGISLAQAEGAAIVCLSAKTGASL